VFLLPCSFSPFLFLYLPHSLSFHPFFYIILLLLPTFFSFLFCFHFSSSFQFINLFLFSSFLSHSISSLFPFSISTSLPFSSAMLSVFPLLLFFSFYMSVCCPLDIAAIYFCMIFDKLLVSLILYFFYNAIDTLAPKLECLLANLTLSHICWLGKGTTAFSRTTSSR